MNIIELVGDTGRDDWCLFLLPENGKGKLKWRKMIILL